MVKKIGVPVDVGRNTWVQTERSAHEAWSKLSRSNPLASALMHELVANMGSQNAVVVSQRTLARMMECHIRTVQRALDHLEADKWIQVVSMGGSGTVCAYVVNDQVAWGGKRENMRTSIFSARVIADIDDQSEHTLTRANLRRIPVLYPNEMQLPSGAGEPPPSQPAIDGMDLDLPAIKAAPDDQQQREQLEAIGQLRIDL